jgi:hypothetical protein
VGHILPDGSLESHEALLTGLMDRLGHPGADLFEPPDSIAARAYRVQADAVAFRSRAPVTTARSQR